MRLCKECVPLLLGILEVQISNLGSDTEKHKLIFALPQDICPRGTVVG
jgi:hypothetical protein